MLLGILDHDGKEVPPGQIGRDLCPEVPCAFRDIIATPRRLREFFAGGLCHSGDIGFIDAEGYLYVTGRKKNMIKSGGISIFPEEIEEVLVEPSEGVRGRGCRLHELKPGAKR